MNLAPLMVGIITNYFRHSANCLTFCSKKYFFCFEVVKREDILEIPTLPIKI